MIKHEKHDPFGREGGVQTEALIQEALDVLFAGGTSIFITHRLSTIMDSDRIITLHKGTIREIGTHRELVGAGGSARSSIACSTPEGTF